MIEVFNQYLQIPPARTQELLDQPESFTLELPEVQAILGSLNLKILRETLGEVQPIFIQHLPPFYQWLQSELSVARVPDSPKHVNQWVISFLKNQERITRLIDLHRPVPLAALDQSVSRLVGLFGELPDTAAQAEWKKAVAFLCLAIVIGCRQPTETELD